MEESIRFMKAQGFMLYLSIKLVPFTAIPKVSDSLQSDLVFCQYNEQTVFHGVDIP